jgi:oxaloacetate decarboxylase alpha subunit
VVDVFRIFDACNDPRNLERATKAAKATGKHVQMAISYATTPYHTKEIYADLAKTYADFGADSICIKDMAGVFLPADAYTLISELKKNTKLPIELHSHCTGGLCEMTYMRAIQAGVDIVDCALSPLSGGTSQPCTESLNAALAGTQYDPKLNTKYLNEASAKMMKVKQKYLDNGLLNPKVLSVNPNILKYQVPGGMLSNLMKQLTDQGQIDRLEDVCKEIPNVRKDMGYPPLVTPLSQMVGTQAVLNVLTGQRYKMVPNEIRDYLHGKYGKSPAPVDPEILKKIVGDDEIITCRPADLLKPEFESLKEKYKDLAKCDEDVLSLALFEKVASEFLQKKYNPVTSVNDATSEEVEEFNVILGGN